MGHAECERNLYKLLVATLRLEKLTTERDTQISKIQQKYAADLIQAQTEISVCEQALEAYYKAHRGELEVDGKKSLQFTHGMMGMRTPTTPALVPLTERWTWPAIGKAVKRKFGEKFFSAATPPLDKIKLRKALTDDQLKSVGLRVDRSDRFYIEPNRLAPTEEVAA